MAKAGRLGRFNQWFNKEPPKKDNHASLSEYTFIDLAQIVCKLPETYVDRNLQANYFFSEDEDYDGYISEPSTYRTVSTHTVFHMLYGNVFILFSFQNNHIKIKRTGTSLSLSENEMDSDIEVDLTLPIERRTGKTRSTPVTPASDSALLSIIDTIDGSATSATEDATAADDILNLGDGVIEDLPLDPKEEKKLS